MKLYQRKILQMEKKERKSTLTTIRRYLPKRYAREIEENVDCCPEEVGALLSTLEANGYDPVLLSIVKNTIYNYYKRTGRVYHLRRFEEGLNSFGSSCKASLVDSSENISINDEVGCYGNYPTPDSDSEKDSSEKGFIDVHYLRKTLYADERI